jgi:hypothetical protein
MTFQQDSCSSNYLSSLTAVSLPVVWFGSYQRTEKRSLSANSYDNWT